MNSGGDSAVIIAYGVVALLLLLGLLLYEVIYARYHKLSTPIPITRHEELVEEKSNPDDELQKQIDAATAELRKANIELQRLDDGKDEFVSMASHQLRTPLAGLQTQLDLANAEGVFSVSPERFQAIDEASARLGHLLSQLLTYARAETSCSLKEQSEVVDLGLLVENSASLFLDAALAKHIDLGFDIAPARARGFPWMLLEALSNLIDNALRYSPDGGTVTVHCGNDNGQPFLGVEDSGPGIPEEHVRHVFERFYRIPGSPGHGCGLGLAIVQEIAELHDARLVFLPMSLGGLHVRIVFPQISEER